MKIKKCRNCYSSNIKKLFSLGKMSFTGKFPKKNKKIKKGELDLIICKKCKLVQLGNDYNLKYLYGPDYGYRTNLNKIMVEHVKKVVNKLSKKTKLKDGEYVLDIASNDGTLLKRYPKKIIRFGIDPTINKFKKEYRSIDFQVSDFFSFKNIKKKTNKKFKIVTALSVFYDLKKPNIFLKDVKKILSKDGVFLIELADISSILKYKMFDAICHEHLEYYSSTVMNEMCKKNDLRIFDIRSNRINGGSKQFYISHKNSRYKTNQKILKKIFKLERKQGLEKISTFKKFFKEINDIRSKLVTYLKKIKSSNKVIHGYGASTKGNVLLQYFNIDKNILSFISEKNKEKFNLFTPGTGIPIISENKSRKIKPDYYLVLPWHFKKEILRREKKILSKGTKFIFPLPKISFN